MSSRSWWIVVFVRSTRMQYVKIAHKLNISNLQNHMQRQILASFLQNIDSLLLLLTQRRNKRGWWIREPREGAHEIRVEFAVYSALLPGRPLALEIQYGGADVWVLPITDLAFAIEVPDRLAKEIDYIRAGAL